MITAANFTFLNYEEGIAGTWMPVGVIVITTAEPALFLLSSLPPSLRPCILYSFFHAFKYVSSWKQDRAQWPGTGFAVFLPDVEGGFLQGQAGHVKVM